MGDFLAAMYFIAGFIYLACVIGYFINTKTINGLLIDFQSSVKKDISEAILHLVILLPIAALICVSLWPFGLLIHFLLWFKELDLTKEPASVDELQEKINELKEKFPEEFELKDE